MAATDFIFALTSKNSSNKNCFEVLQTTNLFVFTFSSAVYNQLSDRVEWLGRVQLQRRTGHFVEPPIDHSLQSESVRCDCHRN